MQKHAYSFDSMLPQTGNDPLRKSQNNIIFQRYMTGLLLAEGGGETKVGVFGHETSGDAREMQEPEEYETEGYDKARSM